MRHAAMRRPRQIRFPVLAEAVAVCVLLGAGQIACVPYGAFSPVVSGLVPVPADGGEPVSPMPHAEAVRVEIAVLGIVSVIMNLGLCADDPMEVPPGAYPAGRHVGAPTPGELGPAITARHVNWAGEPGVFSRLHEIQAGDELTVRRGDRSTAVFRVENVAEYPKNRLPTETVYGNIDHAGLRLLTGGGFNPSFGHYLDNVVISAELVEGVLSRPVDRMASRHNKIEWRPPVRPGRLLILVGPSPLLPSSYRGVSPIVSGLPGSACDFRAGAPSARFVTSNAHRGSHGRGNPDPKSRVGQRPTSTRVRRSGGTAFLSLVRYASGGRLDR
jgi:hypothetical protein